MEKKKSESRAYTAGGLVFVGPLMIGLGLGIYYNITAVGLLVGLGVGFVLFGIVYYNCIVINHPYIHQTRLDLNFFAIKKE